MTTIALLIGVWKPPTTSQTDFIYFLWQLQNGGRGQIHLPENFPATPCPANGDTIEC